MVKYLFKFTSFSLRGTGCTATIQYAAVDARLRQVVRRAFLEHYSYRPQHAWIRQLYA